MALTRDRFVTNINYNQKIILQQLADLVIVAV